MSLKQNFCPSPWFHMTINNAGQYEYCRWAIRKERDSGFSIHDTTPSNFFQQKMSGIRQQLLEGQAPPACDSCHQMEKHSKISGRQRQLLKIGVTVDQFEKTMVSSVWHSEFSKGSVTDHMPQDWQIDLGNYCDSACVFCSPNFSSRLSAEFKKIGIQHQTPRSNWTDNTYLVQQFVDTLSQSPRLAYLHFIGGETLITPAFKTILLALIAAGLNQQATIGFTTNLSSWRDDVIELLKQFQNVNLGMSIESFHHVNEYVRYPIKQKTALHHLEKWKDLALERNWFTQLRTTPTALSVKHLTGIYDYAWNNKISIESCNFLIEPEFLRPSVLPREYRLPIIQHFQQWINEHHSGNDSTIVNSRDPNQIQNYVVQELQSYVNYLESDADQSWRLPELVRYLQKLESNRKNSVLDYLPEYEELFTTAGYRSIH